MNEFVRDRGSKKTSWNELVLCNIGINILISKYIKLSDIKDKYHEHDAKNKNEKINKFEKKHARMTI